jgi:hypothetical protein
MILIDNHPALYDNWISEVYQMKRKWMIGFISILVLLTLSACFPGGSESTTRVAGFFTGVWHGWIAPLSLILSAFNTSIRLYEVNNVGWWYDFGFYMAIISGFGGLSLFRRKKKS